MDSCSHVVLVLTGVVLILGIIIDSVFSGGLGFFLLYPFFKEGACWGQLVAILFRVLLPPPHFLLLFGCGPS